MIRPRRRERSAGHGIDGFAAGCAAASRALASRLYPQFVCDPYASALVEAVGIQELDRVAHGEFDPTIDDAKQWLDDSAFIAARTRHFDDFAQGECDRGARQVVLLGSAFDSRAYRLEWPSGTVVFDLAQPSLVALKASTLAELGARPRAVHRVVGADLRGAWTLALRRAGFSPDLPAVWVVEDVLGRLNAKAQNRLLTGVTVMSAPGSRLAAEYVDQSDGQTTESRPETCRLLNRFTWSLATVETSQLLMRYGLPPNGDTKAVTNQFRFVSASH